MKIKRIAVLFLAIVMMFSITAISASATVDEDAAMPKCASSMYSGDDGIDPQIFLTNTRDDISYDGILFSITYTYD